MEDQNFNFLLQQFSIDSLFFISNILERRIMSNLILTSQWNFDEISIKIEIRSFVRYDLVIILLLVLIL